ncbi:Ig-like domain-containing protein [Chitinophaga filiformis]|uniref:T9SS type A sorting domain-containing protein n=1 Tax=Chitinophaga filiformis TaxID=104663 RepID=UPI001F25F8E4|nr:T9SS type A sorting domain-containing protein [Chitinophaga filiformis]MCF6405625.1 Ig-like domain-containing protein [Chitinophaga filiformis]
MTLTIICCLVSSIFIHARNNSITDSELCSQPAGFQVNNGNNGGAATRNMDTTPVVIAISTTATDGFYGVGSTITFNITFDHVVRVSGGTPALILGINPVNRTALYVSGDGTNTLAFAYTVNTGDTTAKLDYTGTDALLFNGAVIRGSGGSVASLTLPVPGSAGSISGQRTITIDGNAPAAPVIKIPVSNTIFNTTDMLMGGTAEPNALVTVYIDGNVLTTATADAGGSWSSAFTANSLADGNHNIRATATDLAKNVSAPGTSVPIITDVTIPGAMSVAMRSSNQNASYATTGDVITVYFTVDDNIYVPEITILGTPVAVNMVGAKEYVGRYTVTADDPDGEVPFSIDFKDLHGNAGATITATTDNSRVSIDRKRPAVTLNTIEMSPLRRAFLVYISFSEAIADFDPAYLTATNAVISDLTSVSNNVMTVLVTPQYDGIVTVKLAANAAHDVAGNPSQASEDLQVEALFGGYFEKVYPNPASGIMHLHFTGTVNEKAKVTMTSFMGVLVYEKDLQMDNKTLTLDVSGLQPGAYIMRITSKNYNFYTNVMVIH